MSRFENLPKDVIFYLALTLDLPEILSLCSTSKKFNISVCENRAFWIRRLKLDYGINYMSIKPVDPKTYYKFYKDYGIEYIGDQLYWATKEGSLDIIKLLIKDGATNWNLGLAGAARGGHKDIVQLMIDKGAYNWYRGLTGAAKGGHKDIVQMMINEGATNWNDGLYWATRGGHKDIIEFLENKIKERGY